MTQPAPTLSPEAWTAAAHAALNAAQSLHKRGRYADAQRMATKAQHFSDKGSAAALAELKMRLEQAQEPS